MLDIPIDSKREINGQPKGRPRPFAKRSDINILYPNDFYLNMAKIHSWEASSIARKATKSIKIRREEDLCA